MRLLFFLLFFPLLTAQAETPVSVTLKPAAELLFHPPREASAAVLPLAETVVAAEIPGRVEAVLVETGDAVQAGAPLLRLDAAEYRLELAQGEARVQAGKQSLELARKQLERTTSLRGQGQASIELLDQRKTEAQLAQSELESRQAALENGRLRLEKCVVTAPFAGVIVARQAQKGGWVSPGAPLFTLLDPRAVELSAQVDPLWARELPGGRALRFDSEGRGYPVSFRVALPLRHPQARTQEVRLLFSGEAPAARASGRLAWDSPTPHLPAWLPVRREGNLGVFLAEQGKARFVPLPGAQEGAPAPAPAGLSGQVVVEGREALASGMALAVAGRPPE